MEKHYNAQSIEKKWYTFWEKENLFSSEFFATKETQENFCIMLPPPNVTGTLHMGHAFQHTLMDILCRHKRMQGKRVLWQPGTDHAGIATQMVVERNLQQQGIQRKELGREAFVAKIWEWKKKSGNIITTQMRRLGVSVDWQKEKFTLDPDLSQAVNTAFIRLYEQGLIYSGTRLVNWDSHLQTAISDLEVENRQETGLIYSIKYLLTEEKDSFLTVATTRPETIFADCALAVHPEDVRYKKYIGKTVCVPLTDREISVIADPYVDPTFGTGCVKVTPAHDYNDYACGQRHSLPLLNIFHPDARLNEHVPAPYRGLDRFVAREIVVSNLTKLVLLVKTETHIYNKPYSDRSNCVVEPYLTRQWFVRTHELAQKAISVVQEKNLRFIPENWDKTYFHWLENIEDWCISRQLWWGHRIPAWYDEDRNVFVGENEEQAQQKAYLLHGQKVSLQQDEDVLDTWFSSALWPFSTLGWPQDATLLTRFYPTQVLVTGFDIIFFWVARMIMFGCYFLHKVPFKEIYITGLIRDFSGQKMSKSKGNVIDPIDVIDGISLSALLEKRTSNLMQPALTEKIHTKTQKDFPSGIEEHGADALRFNFAASSSFTRDICFDVKRIAGYKNFCNKIWQASYFVCSMLEQHAYQDKEQVNVEIWDKWIMSKLQLCKETVNQNIAQYRFDLASEALYQFIWHEYCDWYLEFVKTILKDDAFTEDQKKTSLHILYKVLDACLRLLHPFMPFITEEIWQKLQTYQQGIKPISISVAVYPQPDLSKVDMESVSNLEQLKEIVFNLRQVRKLHELKGKNLKVFIYPVNVLMQNRVEKMHSLLQSLLSIQLTMLKKDSMVQDNYCEAGITEIKIYVDLAEAFDAQKIQNRLVKERGKNTQDLIFLRKKMENSSFLTKAPAHLIQQTQEKMRQAEEKEQKLEQELERISCKKKHE